VPNYENHQQSSVVSNEVGRLERKHKISIIIPVYNEEAKISIILSQIKQILADTQLEYEIIIINDGSTDDTEKIVHEVKKSDAYIKLISYRDNMGKGHAVKLGVEESNGDVTLFLDGDLNVSPKEIKNYVKELEGFDIAIASKAHQLSRVECTASRRFLSKAYNNLVRLVVGIKIRDTQSGLKIGNTSVLKNIFKIMLVEGYAFDVELLSIATMEGLKIKELPINVTLDSSFDVKEIAKMFIDTLGIAYRLRISKYYRKKIDESEKSSEFESWDHRPTFLT
jgi:glycosyltransferase involved in cell wall biosynthesis